MTHYANVGYTAVAATAITIIAGDTTDAVWFLDWLHRARSTSNCGEPVARAVAAVRAAAPASAWARRLIVFR